LTERTTPATAPSATTEQVLPEQRAVEDIVYATACFVVAAAAVFSVATSDRTPHVGAPHPIAPPADANDPQPTSRHHPSPLDPTVPRTG
jgi:hypothetical protein